MVHKALCVGLNYPNNPWPSLFGCVNDALRWAHLFDKKLSFETRVLIDQTPNGEVSTNAAQIPTHANISAQLRWLCNTSPGDVLVLVFAGYGTQRVWGDRCENALVCADLNLALLGDAELSHIFKSVPAGVMLTVIADCTFGTHILDLPCLITDEKQATQIQDQPVLAPPMHLKSEAWEKNRHARAHPRRLAPVTEEFSPSLRLHPGVTAFCFAAARTDEVALDANVKGHQSGIMSFSLLQALQKFDYQCTYEQLLGAANATIRDIRDKYMPALDQTLGLTFSVDTHPSEAAFLDARFAFLSAERRKLKSEENRARSDPGAESTSTWARPSHEDRLASVPEQIAFHPSPERKPMTTHEYHSSPRHRSNNAFDRETSLHQQESHARMEHSSSSRGLYHNAACSDTPSPQVPHNKSTSRGSHGRETPPANAGSPRIGKSERTAQYPPAERARHALSGGEWSTPRAREYGTFGERDEARGPPYWDDRNVVVRDEMHNQRDESSDGRHSSASECDIPVLFGLPNLLGNSVIPLPTLVALPQIRPPDATPRLAPFMPQIGLTPRSAAPPPCAPHLPQAADPQTPRTAVVQQFVGTPRALQSSATVPSLSRTVTLPLFHAPNAAAPSQQVYMARTPSTQSLSVSSGRETPYMTAPPGQIPTPQRVRMNNCEPMLPRYNSMADLSTCSAAFPDHSKTSSNLRMFPQCESLSHRQQSERSIRAGRVNYFSNFSLR
eukprot:GEMP01026931.1.p1 GENE.GEMP01026931.1~~GEMP01026931.1.p1  ORF type:complete len:727 (+),score=175.92 GEMP01026931.1:97-2277(+)